MNKHEIPTNHLYLEMVRVIRALKPRAFLFENVEGILSSMWYDYSAEKRQIKDWIEDPTQVTARYIRSYSSRYSIELKGRRRADLLADLLNKITAKANQHRKAIRGESFRDVWASFSGLRGYVAQPTLFMPTDLVCPKTAPGDDSRRSQRIDQRHRKEACAFDPGNKNYAATPRQRRVVSHVEQ